MYWRHLPVNIAIKGNDAFIFLKRYEMITSDSVCSYSTSPCLSQELYSLGYTPSLNLIHTCNITHKHFCTNLSSHRTVGVLDESTVRIRATIRFTVYLVQILSNCYKLGFCVVFVPVYSLHVNFHCSLVLHEIFPQLN